MANNTDWMPGRREEQLAMATNWLEVTGQFKDAWGIPQEALTELGAASKEAHDFLMKIQSAERTHANTAECAAAFNRLVHGMRSLKDRYFKKPPLADADFVRLGLHIRDTIRTPVQAPESQVEADVFYPNPHEAVGLSNARRLGEPSADHRAEDKIQVRYGVVADSGPYAIKEPPKSGDDLPYIRVIRRRKEIFEFPGHSGKTAWFCLHWLNPNDKSGPYGPLLSALIP